MSQTKNIALLLETLGRAKISYNRTRVQKTVFLQQKEEGLPYTYEFSKYYYGPYSKELAETISSFVASGILEEKGVIYPYIDDYGGPVVEHVYSLTSFGQEMRRIYNSELTESEKKKIQRACDKFDRMSLADLLSYVYTRYVK